MITPKKLPFSASKVPPEKSRNEIIKLLKDFGIADYAWAEDLGQVVLSFRVEVEYEGQPKLWNVIIRPPVLIETQTVYDEQKRMKVKKDIPNYVQSFRFLLNHLKTKLTAVACGMVKFEEEFMADIAVPTPQGPRRLAEALKEYKPGLLLEGPSEMETKQQ